MAFYSKIRRSVPTHRVTKAATAPVSDTAPKTPAQSSWAAPTPAAKGFPAASGFEPAKRVADKASEGRAKAGGVQDDSIGRAKAGGVQDDSIGRAKAGGVQDDSIGRAQAGGVQDDSIGRAKSGGVQDDSIGRAQAGGVQDDSIGGTTADPGRAALVGPETDPASVAARKELYSRLENPSFASSLPKGAHGAKEVLRKGILDLAKPMPSAAQQQLTTLMGRLDEEGLRFLGAALERNPQMFSTQDTQGGTLLGNLARLAQEPLNSKLAGDTSMETILRGVLRDVANPNRIDQGTAPTCTVTSVQYELVADEPAEYARLMADLCGPTGKATMRGGGALTIDSGDASRLARDWRSASDTIFQTAAMEYANGRFQDFDPVAGKSIDRRTGEEYRGIKPSQQANLLSHLFGVKYSTDNLKDEKEGAKVLETLRGFDARGAENRPIILHIDQGDYNHAVTLERVADGRVQYRDPYGVLRSIPEALFPKYVMAVQRPIEAKA